MYRYMAVAGYYSYVSGLAPFAGCERGTDDLRGASDDFEGMMAQFQRGDLVPAEELEAGQKVLFALCEFDGERGKYRGLTTGDYARALRHCLIEIAQDCRGVEVVSADY